jgi:hypothetical protein
VGKREVILFSSLRKIGIRVWHERELLDIAAEIQKERQDPEPVPASIDVPGEFVSIDRIIRTGK